MPSSGLAIISTKHNFRATIFCSCTAAVGVRDPGWFKELESSRIVSGSSHDIHFYCLGLGRLEMISEFIPKDQMKGNSRRVSQQYLLCNAFLHLMLQGLIVPTFSHLQRDNYQVSES